MNLRLPEAFEQRCADILQSVGWSARLTPRTGDQGADVIAQKSGIRAVLQCKLYSKPVGNSAVQEVFAAKRFVNADKAAVVADAGFTRSARVLARSASVLLLAAADLWKADRLFGVISGHVIRGCPRCLARLRLPTNRAGVVICPNCGKDTRHIT